MSESREITERRVSDSDLTRGRSSDSGLRAAVPTPDSHPKADGKPSDSALTADGKTADGNGLKSRQEPSSGADKIKLTLRLNPGIVMELKLFCALKKKRLAEVVEAAVSDFCSRHPHGIDDLDDDDVLQRNVLQTRTIIIQIYGQLTGNPWRDRDSEALKRIPDDLPLEVVEMAMLMARLRAPGPIRTFAYFVPEILNPSYLKVKGRADYIRYLRRKVEGLPPPQR